MQILWPLSKNTDKSAELKLNNFNKFWVAGFPGLAIFTMAVGANFIGDGMRDLLDPKLRKQF